MPEQPIIENDRATLLEICKKTRSTNEFDYGRVAGEKLKEKSRQLLSAAETAAASKGWSSFWAVSGPEFSPFFEFGLRDFEPEPQSKEFQPLRLVGRGRQESGRTVRHYADTLFPVRLILIGNANHWHPLSGLPVPSNERFCKLKVTGFYD